MRKEMKLSASKWKSELNSPAFIAGLEAAVNYTRNHGVETGFQAWFDGSYGRLDFPEFIAVGNERKVCFDGSLNRDRVEGEYRKQTGLPAPHTDEWKSRTRGWTVLQRAEDIGAYRRWEEDFNTVNPEIATRIHYPELDDRMYEDANTMSEYEESHPEFIFSPDAIAVHTHPTGGTSPSGQDLRSLNYGRAKNLKEDTPFNPLSLILGVRNNLVRESYPFAIFQEKTERPLRAKSDFETLSGCIHNAMNGNIIMLEKFLGENADRAIRMELKVRREYNWARGMFVPGKKKLVLDRDFGYGVFGGRKN